MNPEKEIALLEQIVDEILAAVEEVIRSGEILSDELQGMIAEELEFAIERIMKLRSQSPAEGLREIPEGQPPATGPSSNVAGMAYNPKTKDMLVQFLGKYPNRDGPTYKYNHVPKEIASLLQKGSIPASTKGKNKWGSWHPGKVPSFGASVYRLLNQAGAPYQRIT